MWFSGGFGCRCVDADLDSVSEVGELLEELLVRAPDGGGVEDGAGAASAA